MTLRTSSTMSRHAGHVCQPSVWSKAAASAAHCKLGRISNLQPLFPRPCPRSPAPLFACNRASRRSLADGSASLHPRTTVHASGLAPTSPFLFTDKGCGGRVEEVGDHPAGPGDLYATPLGGALCCDATLVSPLTRSFHPQPCAAESDGVALRVTQTCELGAGGPQRLLALGAEVGGDGMTGCSDSCATSSVSAPSVPRQLSAALLAVTVQQAVAGTALGPQGRQRALRDARLARTWTSCCTWQQRRALAAGCCGRRADQETNRQT